MSLKVKNWKLQNLNLWAQRAWWVCLEYYVIHSSESLRFHFLNITLFAGSAEDPYLGGCYIHLFVFCTIYLFWNLLFLQSVSTNKWICARCPDYRSSAASDLVLNGEKQLLIHNLPCFSSILDIIYYTIKTKFKSNYNRNSFDFDNSVCETKFCPMAF